MAQTICQDGGDSRTAGQHHAQRLGNAGHGTGSTHNTAGPGAWYQIIGDLFNLVLANLGRPIFGPEAPVNRTGQRDKGQGLFELESNRLLEINLKGMIWTKMGSMVAITTHHDPLTLVVAPNKPIITDPNATVAWSGSLAPELKTDISFKTFMGRGSGESIQMKFQGQGFVVIQPCEETYFQTA
jgi:hypothetical protein